MVKAVVLMEIKPKTRNGSSHQAGHLEDGVSVDLPPILPVHEGI